TSGGPYTTIATNLTAGITNYTYTDNTVTNGGSYYYVVSAVNAVGEGPNSSQVTPPIIIPSQINCGGPAAGSYISDIYFGGGQTFSVANAINTNGLANPAPMTVYQSQRYGNINYTLPYLTPNTSYKVRLHFAEIYWNSTGQRVFNVFVNGAQVLANFDIVAAAGGGFTGNIQSFNAISDANGFINVQFVTVTDNACCGGIELILNPTNVIPSAPTGLSATVSTGQVSLVWTAPASATSFNVKRSTVNGGSYTTIASNLTSTAFIDYSFTPGTTYYYVVTAKDALGESPNSNQATATPTAGLPDLVITAISWTPNPAYSGNSVLFSATVKNQGSAPTPSGVVLGVGFSIDGGASYPYSATDTTSLFPGSSVVLTASGGGAPGGYWPATPGAHTVTGNVDDVNRIPESNENNNLLATNFSIYTAGYGINSGGGAMGAFAADENYSGGTTGSTANAIDLTFAGGAAAPQSVYQTERWGTFSYTLTNLIPNQTYAVRLHFAEIMFTNAGQRVFNVTVNGTQVLTNFDIIAQTGGQNKALVKRFNALADLNGNITIQYSPVNASPKSSGIEIIATNNIANASPVLSAISNMIVNANSPLAFTAMAIDPDQPLQTLTYSLLPGAPTGATINSASGAFSWTPPLAQSTTTNTISVRVTDNGSPALSATRIFSVTVVAPPRISQPTISAGGNITLMFTAFPGKTYQIQYKNNLSDSNWTILGTNVTASSSSVSVPDNMGGSPHRFYRVLQNN
ncbi:MAG TPA: malectin domain-containing carbohydrate-binding protein, partial [Verrucomicrobiae bacterium]|nr:malectin domain-containing carbohydrate-binding protein [Verrucomicrobiae bacterium]